MTRLFRIEDKTWCVITERMLRDTCKSFPRRWDVGKPLRTPKDSIYSTSLVLPSRKDTTYLIAKWFAHSGAQL